MAQVKQLLALSFGELFHQAEPDVQRWEEYLVSVYQMIVDEVPCSASHQCLVHRLLLLCVMLSSVPTIPRAQKA